jgi:hypothetical protein
MFQFICLWRGLSASGVITRFELRKEVTFQISGGSCFPVTLLAKSLRIFTDLAVGETAANLSEAKGK